MRVKISFAGLFTAVSQVIILLTTVSLIVIFFYNLRTITTDLVESNTRTTVAYSRDMIVSTLKYHEEALKHTSTGIRHLFNQENITTEIMEAYLAEIMENVPNSLDIYFVNNIKWNIPGGFAVFGGGWVPGEAWDNTQRPWFLAAKEARGGTAFSEPYVDADTGEIVITISMTVFNVDGEDIGVVADDVEVNYLGQLLNEMRSFQEQEIYILNNDGLYITNDDINMVMEKDFFTDKSLNHYRNDVLNSDNIFIIDKNIMLFSSYITGTDWILITTIPNAVIFAEANRLLLFIIIITSGLLIFAAFILIIFIRRMVKPLGNVVSTLNDISSDWNLSKRIDPGKTGGIKEISEISSVFNLTFESIEKLIGTIIKQTHTLALTGIELSNNSSKTAAAVEQMTANIQSIKLRNADQDTEIIETSSYITSITKNINNLNKFINKLTDNVNQSSAAIEEMIAYIKNVTDTLNSNTKNVNELSESSNAGKNSLQVVSDAFREIARESEGLLEINKVMNSIASQTNLLSMNAAIEAAHAGEVGKGFAVVAGEIRKLAESSANQSKTTGNMLKKIKAAIDSITQSITAVIERFERIDEKVKTVTEQENNMLSAMKEQEIESQHILSSINSLSVITGQVNEESNKIAIQSDEVSKKHNVLEKIASELTVKIDEMVIGTDQINAAISHVNEMSGDIKESISVLDNEMSQFKVNIK